MKKLHLGIGIVAAQLIVIISTYGAVPLGTAFTYQGRLMDGASPANGSYELGFRVYDDETGGVLLAQFLPLDPVEIAAGLFSTEIDFGASVFTGDRRWLELDVRVAGATTWTTLQPRQELTASPHAQYSMAVPWAGIADIPAGFSDGVDDTGSGFWQANGNTIFNTNGGPVGVGTTAPLFDLHLKKTVTLAVNQPPAKFGVEWRESFIGASDEEWLYFRVGGSGIVPIGQTGAHIVREAGTKLHFSTEDTMNSGILDPGVTLTDSRLGINVTVPEATLHISGGSDAEPVGGGQFVIGPTDATNMSFDNNEIMARLNGQTSTLYLNNDGGNVLIAATGPGAMAIGTTNIPTGVKLAVDGKGLFEEVEVQLSQDWPDYVFEDDYELMSLSELEQSIRTNKHLPGVPSANEVKTAGLAVGAMQANLLEKIEELTLHVIDLNHRLETVQQDNDTLRSRMGVLEVHGHVR
jgi:hypothetical protein